MKIQDTYSSASLASILGYKARSVTYFAFGSSDEKNYFQFEIKKKCGGVRKIAAPSGNLKLLQRRLLREFQKSISEHEKESGKDFFPYAHGFVQRRSIASNAALHRNKKFVINFDIENFFESIKFHRLRGCLIHDNRLQFAAPVATMICRIATYKHSLPQGSPLSPLLSNVYSNALDIRIAKFAAKHGCTYSRYADDITISGNDVSKIPLFCSHREASPGTTTGLEICESILREMSAFGFSINAKKTRLSINRVRQTVTGLCVNKVVNAPIEYRKRVRAMTHHFTMFGEYRYRGSKCSETKGTVRRLEGALGYLHWLKLRRRDPDRVYDIEFGDYAKFLLANNFLDPSIPMVMCEGPSDGLYLRSAMRQSRNDSARQPSDHAIGSPAANLKIFNYKSRTAKILGLGDGGVSQLRTFVQRFPHLAKKFDRHVSPIAVVILIDNDAEGLRFFDSLKHKQSPCHIPADVRNHCAMVASNIYVLCLSCVKNSPSVIEDLFDADVLSIPVGGRTFTKQNTFDRSKHFGKVEFYNSVVLPNEDEIDFSRFKELISKIDAVLVAHSISVGPPHGRR